MQHWPADQVERRAVASLIPYARNARTHSDKQIEQLVASIGEWGWTVPVLIDEGGTIIAGHGRVLAAERLSIDQVPCIVARGWSEAQRRAYVIADNKLTELGEWNPELLEAELSDLRELNFDLDLLGIETKRERDNDASPQLGNNLKYAVIVRCASELEQMELLARFETEGLKCEALIT